MLKVLAEKGLIRGRAIGVDATTLEANAAMRSIVRREDGTTYHDFLVSLAKQSGIETPTRADLARIDKKREKKGSNDDWKSPTDPDAKITKMKDGRTHLAHKAEHATDMDSGAVLAVTVQDATRGDSASLKTTMVITALNMAELAADPSCSEKISPQALKTWVADKGYHSNETMRMTAELGLTTYISEPDRGQRKWKGEELARRGTYDNRRRITRRTREGPTAATRGAAGAQLRTHAGETGGMRRTHLRGHENVLKRYLVHVAGFNLGLVMRAILLGVGTPRGLQGRLAACFDTLAALWMHVKSLHVDGRDLLRWKPRLRPILAVA